MLTYQYRPLRLAEAVNRLFDESVINPQMLNPTVAALPLDVKIDGDDYLISAAVPGLRPEDLHLEVLGDTVTIRGEVTAEEKREEGNWLLRERRFGKFARTVNLPTEVDGSKAEAVVEHGVLTLRLPKAETARPKSIKVKTK